MHLLLRSLIFTSLLTLATSRAVAEPGVLWVKVLNLKNRAIPKLKIGTEGPGAVAPTDDRGLAKIRLNPQNKAGSWVTLEVASANYAFVSPWNRKVIVPPFENEADNYVTVYLTAKGEREALESGKFAIAFAAKFNATLTLKPKEEQTEFDLKTALAEVARSFGFQPDEVERAILAYEKRAIDPYEKGEIALFKQDYSTAIEQLSMSYALREANFEKAEAELVEVALALGRALMAKGRYYEAVEKFRKADKLRNDAPDILNDLGLALIQAGSDAEAATVYTRVIAITEKTLGSEHPNFTFYLSNQALLYTKQGKYDLAELLFKKALAFTEKLFGKEHPSTVSFIANLVAFLRMQGRYPEAEPLAEQALVITTKTFGEEHAATASSLNSLAMLYVAQGKVAKAELLFKRALTITDKKLGADDLSTAAILNNLSELYRAQNSLVDAELHATRALKVAEKGLGAEHPDIALYLNNLALIYVAQATAEVAKADRSTPPNNRTLTNTARIKFDEAEQLYKRALATVEKVLGTEHLSTVANLNNLAVLYRQQGRHAEAEPFAKRVVTITEKTLGPNHTDLGIALHNLGYLYFTWAKYVEAELFLERALAIFERAQGKSYPDIAIILESYAAVLRKLNQEAKAADLETRAKGLRAKAGKQ